ncbi:hypothetical protein [Arthrobacter oryzae]|uniref:Uncharacterized protein n=1 Tax=Arthrobacter oryzae TaxID=409290 RepID=A0A495E9U4_9MICC|nr:hypothetical protein [Arthrobacter oryzae]RKR13678.1 hypothetical protein C8D78_3334 [Arthrobacter oryzae]
MFSSPVIVIVLVSVFSVLMLISAVRVVRARSWAARLNDLLIGLAGGVLALAVLSGFRGRVGVFPAVPLLALAGAWFLFRAAFRGRRIFRGTDRGRAAALYSAVLIGIGTWSVVSGSRAGGAGQDHPGQELGGIIVHLTGAIALVLAGAGWLLATFATPAETGMTPVSRTRGLQEALLAVGLAVFFYAAS